MKPINNKLMFIKFMELILLTMCLFFFLAPAFAEYEINRYTIDGGGGVSTGGQYIVRGTIGQHDAAYSAGGDYEMLGGFWPAEPFCFVDFKDFARFAEYWLYIGNYPADLYDDDIVDYKDLNQFTEEWLYYCPYAWPLK